MRYSTINQKVLWNAILMAILMLINCTSGLDSYLNRKDRTSLQIQQAYIKGAGTEAGDQLGYRVAIDSDLLVIGAPYEDSNSTVINSGESSNSAGTSGAAYVFTRSGNTWIQEAYLKPFNTDPDDLFGCSVAVDSDTVVVGGGAEDSNSTVIDSGESDNSSPTSGAAYVFVRSGTTWSQQAYLKQTNTGANDGFGYRLDISGDTVVVSAAGEDNSSTGIYQSLPHPNDNLSAASGAVYVYTRSNTTWSWQAFIKASTADAGDNLGTSLAIDGDYLVVGAHHEDSSSTIINGSQSLNDATNSGAAFVFKRNGTTWSQQAYLKASNAEGINADTKSDEFGNSVDIYGDTIVVGARWEDSSSKVINGDQSDNSAVMSGAAYIYIRSGTEWSQQAYVKASNTNASDRFGWRVKLNGDRLVVSAHREDSRSSGINGIQDDNSISSSGAAYFFVRNGTSWLQQAYIKASNPGIDDWFGYGLAIDEDTIAVGAPWEDSGAVGINGNENDNSASKSGAVYIFDL